MATRSLSRSDQDRLERAKARLLVAIGALLGLIGLRLLFVLDLLG